MIGVSLTFFLQVFHFGVAYMFIRYIFLQPALRILAERDREKQALKKRIMVGRKQVAHHKQIKQEHQKACQQTFVQALLQVKSLEKEQSTTFAQMADPAPVVIDREGLQVEKDKANAWITKKAECHEESK